MGLDTDDVSLMDGLLTETRLQTALKTRPFRLLSTIDSTNTYACELALQGVPSGTVVVAETQTHGRGRLGRNWYDVPKCALLFSVILRPTMITAEPHVHAQVRLARLNMLGALAVAEVIAEYAPDDVRIKWPNDIQLKGKKVAGILPETSWQGETFGPVILGVGLNIGINFVGTSLAETAISLQAVSQQPVDRAMLLARILYRVDWWSARLDDAALFTRWRDWLDTIGRDVTVTEVATQRIVAQGHVLDVNTDGALLVRSDDGSIRRILAGEVTLRINHA